MGNVINCKECGRIFTYYGAGYKICPQCKNNDDSNLKKIRDVLYEEKECNVTRTSELTNIPERTILRYIDEGLLSLNNVKITTSCKSCGKLITNETYCKICKNQLLRDLNQTKGYYMSKETTKNSERVRDQMRYLSKDRTKK